MFRHPTFPLVFQAVTEPGFIFDVDVPEPEIVSRRSIFCFFGPPDMTHLPKMGRLGPYSY